MKRSARAIVLGTALVPLLTFCTADPDPGGLDGAGVDVPDITSALDTDLTDLDIADPGQIRYVLDWAWDGAESIPGGGWQVINDLGFNVTVTHGYMVSFSAQLVPCPDDVLDGGTTTGALLRTLFGSGVAHASDGTEELDSSGVQAYVEGLKNPVATLRGPAQALGHTYCRVHYLIARGPEGIASLPTDVAMEGTSLYLTGTWRLGQGDETSFEWRTASPTALFGELEGTLNSANTGAEVTITRSLGRLFDGVDFAVMTADEGEKQALLNLRKQALITLEER